jgi:hypothetical protein
MFWIQTALALLSLALLVAVVIRIFFAPSIALTGTNLVRKVSGSIDDGDDSTRAAGRYDVQATEAEHRDGRSLAKSRADSASKLECWLTLEQTPNTPGPVHGPAAGIARSEVESTFAINRPHNHRYQLSVQLTPMLTGPGTFIVTVSMHLRRGAAVIAPGLVVRSYELREDPNDATKVLLAIDRGAPISIDDGQLVIDPRNIPAQPFFLAQGIYTIAFRAECEGYRFEQANLVVSAELAIV